uniref:C-type lectin domain-containing protein n=1 Tax=Monodelphis domestica TaxID=13616 RepID=A0A5F8H0A7_MONDO
TELQRAVALASFHVTSLLHLPGQQDVANAISARSSCPEGIVFHGSHCYGLLGQNRMETWNSAELQCQAHHSSHLGSLLNKAEGHFVATMIKEYSEVRCPIWIGLHDPNKVGPRWLSLFLSWESCFPNGTNPNYCASLSPQSGFYSWRDECCEKRYLYVCKFKA